MTKNLHVTVCECQQDEHTVFEGTCQLEGGTPFKLTKARSQDTKFSSKASLTKAVTNFAKRYDLELELDKGNATESKSRCHPVSDVETNCIASDTVIV